MLKCILFALTGKQDTAKTSAPAPNEPASPAKEALISVYDAYSRKVQITRSEWCEKMLLPICS